MSGQTLHLEPDVARATVQKMKTNAEEIQTLSKQLQTQINDFVGTNWQGNAAIQFQTEFDGWFQKVSAEATALTTLSDTLETEIQNWEAAAAQLGG